MRLVADTNIVVSGLLWRGPSRQLLDAAREGLVNLCTSIALLSELEEVLRREKFSQRLLAANVTPQDLVMGYAALATVVSPAVIAPVILRDPDDDAVIACAVGAKATVIVSGDLDLLTHQRYQDISILTAADFVRTILPTLGNR